MERIQYVNVALRGSSIGFRHSPSVMSSTSLPCAKRFKAAHIVGTSSTRSALINTLNQLHADGLLDTKMTPRELRREIHEHARADTRYGKVVQTMKIDNVTVPYIDPRALLVYLCTVSAAFSRLMKSIATGMCRIVLYNDGVTPGNVFRPDAGRKFEAFYWAVIEWPDWLLQRSMCWQTLSIIRSKLITEIPGGICRIMPHFLNLFRTLSEGVLLPADDGEFMFTAQYHCILADLVGHQNMSGWKGPSGIRCCLDCSNMANRQNGPRAGEITPRSFDRSAWTPQNDNEVWFMVDQMKSFAESPNYTKTKLEKLQTECGINYIPGSLLCADTLRDIYSPTKNHLRDWQHILCQDGLANTEVAMVLHRMQQSAAAITLEMVQSFVVKCTLPRAFGKMEKEWLGKRRLKPDTLSSFSSIMLLIIPTLYLFMQFYNIADLLPDEFACFEQLHFIVSMLRLGPTASMSYIEKLRTFIADHHRRFVSLYGTRVKPKQHHMHHVVDGMLWASKLLACFVTERKNKETKRHAVTTFRTFEMTTLSSVLNAQVQWMTQGHDIFQCTMLVSPKVAHVPGHVLQCAKHALCTIGSLFARDIVYIRDGAVGRIENFWKMDSEGLMVQLDVFPCVHGDTTIRDESHPVARFVPIDDIVEACIWFYARPSVIKIALPPIVLLQ